MGNRQKTTKNLSAAMLEELRKKGIIFVDNDSEPVGAEHNSQTHVYKTKKPFNNANYSRTDKANAKEVNFVKDIKQFIREDKYDNTVAVNETNSRSINAVPANKTKNASYPVQTKIPTAKPSLQRRKARVFLILVIIIAVLIPVISFVGSYDWESIYNGYQNTYEENKAADSTADDASYAKRSEINEAIEEHYNDTVFATTYDNDADSYNVYIYPFYSDNGYDGGFSCLEENTSDCREDWDKMVDDLAAYSTALETEFETKLYIYLVDPDSYETVVSVYDGKVINDYIDDLE